MHHTTYWFATGATLFTTIVPAQTFDREVAVRNLRAPTGILVAADRDVYFTEVPEPGTMGGANAVSLKDAGTGQIVRVSTGEPEPVNLAMDPSTGAIYWTCRSAGVILRRLGGQITVVRRGLEQPSGISAPGNGRLYITQLPTPGVSGANGGRNTVDSIDLATGVLRNLTTGEPEPYDIVADAAGNAWWTCRSAGVILHREAASGRTSVLLDGLAEPAGIDRDAMGRLYFTEVPDAGRAGAGNRVWQFDPATSNFTLISAGEPEPIDVAVTPDGSAVYWTCRTAGVIVRAERVGSQPQVTSPSSFGIGETVRLFLDAGPAAAGRMYLAAASLGRGPIELGDRSWALTMDAVFGATVGVGDSPMAVGFAGLLDFTGMATTHLGLPADPTLRGLDVFSGFVVLDPMAPFGVGDFSSTHRFEIR